MKKLFLIAIVFSAAMLLTSCGSNARVLAVVADWVIRSIFRRSGHKRLGKLEK